MKEKLLKPKYILTFTAVIMMILFQLIQSTEVQTKTLENLSAGHIDSDSTNNFGLITGGSTIWSINYNTSWEDLHTYLPSGKMSGTAVWVKLVPPSKSPLYSEPYKNDYIRWAQEIARLSLRYSNLKGYSIENLQDNINSGYLTQANIDNMQSAGLAINPKLQFIITDKNYRLFYVDKDAKGTGDGSSWANAATSVSNLDWTYIKGGDTIYISGGSISKIYDKDSLTNKFLNTPIIITKGIDPGHNGEVIYSTTRVGGTVSSFFLYNCVKIKMTGLTFRYEKNVVATGAAIWIKYGEHNQIDNCIILSNGHVNGLLTNSSKHNIITNNSITILDNPFDTDQDGMRIWSSGGGDIIRGNKILLESGNVDHKDVLQIGTTNLTTKNEETIISNNLLIFDNANEYATSCLQIDVTNSDNRFLIYNNVMVANSSQMDGCVVYSINTSDKLSVRLYNNTIAVHGSKAFGLVLGCVDSLIMKNNVISHTSGGLNPIWFRFPANVSYESISYKDIDYNQYYRNGTSIVMALNNVTKNWSQWTAMGNDVNGNINPFIFKNMGSREPSDYMPLKGSSGIDDGLVLSAIFNTDYFKNKRPIGLGWDRGAIEYIP